MNEKTKWIYDTQRLVWKGVHEPETYLGMLWDRAWWSGFLSGSIFVLGILVAIGYAGMVLSR